MELCLFENNKLNMHISYNITISNFTIVPGLITHTHTCIRNFKKKRNFINTNAYKIYY